MTKVKWMVHIQRLDFLRSLSSACGSALAIAKCSHKISCKISPKKHLSRYIIIYCNIFLSHCPFILRIFLQFFIVKILIKQIGKHFVYPLRIKIRLHRYAIQRHVDCLKNIILKLVDFLRFGAVMRAIVQLQPGQHY